MGERIVRARGRLVAMSLPIAALSLLVVSAPAGHDQHVAPSLQALLDSPAHDLPFDPALASVSCPYERGHVKEGADADRFNVNNTAASVSVNYLRNRAKPTSYPRSHRVTSTELHTYKVTAYLTQYKVEADGDVHLVLKDSSGRSMIAEIPYGACVPTTSRWTSAIASARSTFAHQYAATTSWQHVHRLVTVQGIGYMDPLHGQTGVAPNGVELHPVTHVSFH